MPMDESARLYWNDKLQVRISLSDGRSWAKGHHGEEPTTSLDSMSIKSNVRHSVLGLVSTSQIWITRARIWRTATEPLTGHAYTGRPTGRPLNLGIRLS